MIYQTINPPIQKYEEKSYSIEPDLVNGWKGRTIQSKQIPLQFYYHITDSILFNYEQNLLEDKLVYLGPRHSSNISAIQQYAVKNKNKNVNEAYIYNEEFYKYTYKYQNIKTQIKENQRPFIGMNSKYQYQEEMLKFDSNFQCGNLDLVTQTSRNEYDLFMRVDTNTKGHFSWFFFKVISNKPQKVKFNICNFHKSHLLYSKGMKPYVFSRYGSKQWKQKGNNVQYKKNTKYNFIECKPIYELSFEIQFKKEELELWFAYSIPYSYSYLLNFIDQIKRIPQSEQFLKVQMKYRTISGLKIPVLTIGNPQEGKKTVMITGRMHPGQSQGSWMLHNFISFLCSQQAYNIRKEIVFRIIPMVNVDGVIIGNFRTNIKGSDVNRQYNFQKRAKQNTESFCVREVANQCARNLLTYMDFHGHSTRKGVFIFGPQYPITDQEYYVSRIYPKILALQTQMFRYYSCIFRISDSKAYTARAAMFRHYKIPYVFTIQASTHSFIDSNNTEVLFSQKLYKDMGGILSKQFQKVIPTLIAFQAKKQQLKKYKIQVKLQKRLLQPSLSSEQINGERITPLKIRKKQTSPIRMNTKQSRQFSSNSKLRGINQLMEMFPNLSDIFKEIKSQKIITNVQQDDKSDCESEDQNYTKQQLKSLFNRKKRIVQGRSLINIKRQQIKMMKTNKEKQKEKEKQKNSNKFNPFKLESKQSLYKKIVLDDGFVGRIKNSQEVSAFRSIKKLDLEGKQLPSINASPKQKSTKSSVKKQKFNSRNKTLQREYSKYRPAVYQSPLSHRNHQGYRIQIGHEETSLQKQIIQQGRNMNFPFREPGIRLTKQATEPRQVLLKLGVPKLSNQITEVSVRRDYIRRKNKANRSYQLANLSLDLYH